MITFFPEESENPTLSLKVLFIDHQLKYTLFKKIWLPFSIIYNLIDCRNDANNVQTDVTP